MQAGNKGKSKGKKGSANNFIVKAGGRNVEVVPFTPPKFAHDDPQAYKYLEENGYVVISNVATKDEVAHGIDLFWKYMKHAHPKIDREDISTWNSNWPQWSATGIIAADGIGQSEFAWFARGLPNVKKIFSNIWDGEEDLLVSFDAAGVVRPIEYNPDWTTRGGWFHFDQNGYQKKGLHCVQGLLNFLPSGGTDGGLTVVPRTHLLFDKLFASRADICDKFGSDFVMLTKQGVVPEIWNDPQYYPVKLCLDPGDFALWDSRVAHCNHPPSPKKELPKPDIRRLVSYVCMTPVQAAKKNKKELLQQRLEAFRDGLTTSHWPHEYQPRGRVSQEQPEFFLNAHQKALLVGNERTAALGDGPLSSKNVPFV